MKLRVLSVTARIVQSKPVPPGAVVEIRGVRFPFVPILRANVSQARGTTSI